VLSFQPSPTGTIPANNWSALYLGGKSFTTVFPVGYNGSVSLYDAIGPDRGAITGPVSTAIQSRINLGDSVIPPGPRLHHRITPPTTRESSPFPWSTGAPWAAAAKSRALPSFGWNQSTMGTSLVIGLPMASTARPTHPERRP
jgi:hypothetical protein